MSARNTGNEFWQWFDKQRGSLSVRQIEERAGCPRSRIGNPYSARKKPTVPVCVSIANGLNIDVEEVLKQAGVSDFEAIKTGYLPKMDGEKDFISSVRQLLLERKEEDLDEVVIAWLKDLEEKRKHNVFEYIVWQYILQAEEEQKKMVRATVREWPKQHEAELVKKVTDAMESLKSRGVTISQQAVSKEVSVSQKYLRQYPAIVELLEKENIKD